MNGQNAGFTNDPFQYAQQVPINLINMRPAGPVGPAMAARAAMGIVDQQKWGWFDLSSELVGNRQNVFLSPLVGGAPPQGDHPIQAYWCPYVPPGPQGNSLAGVPYVDLPTVRPTYDYMFTGAMNGCSLVVTQNRPGVLRVYHDSAHLPNTFATENVLARLDYCPTYFNSPHYYFPNTDDGGQSANFLYFDRGDANGPAWKVVCQPQECVGAGTLEGRVPMDFNRNLAVFEFAAR